MVGAGVEGKPQSNRARYPWRAPKSLTTLLHLLDDLIEDGDLADMIETDGRIMMP